MEKLSFNLLQIIEENTLPGERYISPKYESFVEIPNKFHTVEERTFYEVTIETNLKYFWIALEYGKPAPRDPLLTNIETGEKKDNLRGSDELELLKQVFCLYVYNSNTLYLSNSQKKNLLSKILKEKTGRDFLVKNLYKNKEEFLKILKEVDEISFTNVKDLFSNDSDERQALIDLTGTDAPETFSISAKYSGVKIIPFIRKLIEGKENYSINDLIIRGKDDKSFDIIYNVDTFVRKIDIEVAKNDDQKYDAENVKNALIDKLGI